MPIQLCCITPTRSESPRPPNSRPVSFSDLAVEQRHSRSARQGGSSSINSCLEDLGGERTPIGRSGPQLTAQEVLARDSSLNTELSLIDQSTMGNITSKVKKRLAKDGSNTKLRPDNVALDGKWDERERRGRKSRLTMRRRSRKQLLSDQSLEDGDFDPDAQMIDMQV